MAAGAAVGAACGANSVVSYPVPANRLAGHPIFTETIWGAMPFTYQRDTEPFGSKLAGKCEVRSDI
ncbi:hypothetical protein BA059_21975 [Mycolicibacterium sp. (ex Dasyatis americana)]|uniref:Uncharacterized protein n=1 Tax=Mycobacterium syngnathidarum TaxID=1908205 RepID=A0A1S1K0W9_9MYCO|nr:MULTISPECIES: hypothetical protein [Mycobacterium]OFB36961.1 hypothetical protein BA059_21975 [Mycolicibacterium sp. (ex Dasyatis americana)]MCG7608989.1 hypothetical protein [Mycobacterium sp. CnD-18-1]OHU00016.1 hypothetical protein BKG61_12800 [Mycobacterium syngnathidarum]OLT90154.1 hypothetical protein BKG60_24500 [Mycobacterium syngnathidarum]TMS49663.1 hypothetical protein E0T84_25725 [Mycobacterium sp. DBP42]